MTWRDRVRRQGWLLALAGLVGLVLIVAFSMEPEGEDRPDTTATTPARPSGTADLRFPPRGKYAGFSDNTFQTINEDSKHNVGVTADDEVAWARGVGANVHRITFAWIRAEPERGRLDRGYIDMMADFVRRFEAAGGRVIVSMWGAPDWASDRAECNGCYRPPTNDAAGGAAWRSFLRLVAKTFPNALAFEVWNEPNLVGFWGPKANPVHYARLANAALDEFSRAAPRARVLVGSLAGFAKDEPGQMSVSSFLREAVRGGLSRDFDGLSWHAYPLQVDGRVQDLDAPEGLRELKADVRRGAALLDPTMPQWITEAGVTTSGKNWGVSAEEQASGVLRLLDDLFDTPRVKAVLLHNLFEAHGYPQTSIERGFGVAKGLGRGVQTPKPAWCALREIAVDAGPPPPGVRCL